MSERYLPDCDQIALARSMGESLRSILPLSRLQESHDESAAAWTALRDLGVLGISMPAEDGGSGLDATEEALIVIELGRQLVAPSVLATLGAAHLGSRGRHLAAEGVGRVAAAYERSDRFVVVGGQGANVLLAQSDSAPPRLFAFSPSSRVSMKGFGRPGCSKPPGWANLWPRRHLRRRCACACSTRPRSRVSRRRR